MFQTRAQEKMVENSPNGTEISSLPDKGFKAIVIRMLTELGKRLHEHSENFNKELEIIKNNQSDKAAVIRTVWYWQKNRNKNHIGKELNYKLPKEEQIQTRS